jgi:hypothetical protein
LRHIRAFNRQNLHKTGGPPTFETPDNNKKTFNLQIDGSDNSMLDDYDIEDDLDNDLKIDFDDSSPQKTRSSH